MSGPVIYSLTEKDGNDAPLWLPAPEAQAWAQGFNAALTAVSEYQQRIEAGLLTHRYLMGGGRDERADYCSCGEWTAEWLTDYGANHAAWRSHVARALAPPVSDDTGGTKP